jgi:hypothetical protein
MAARRLNSRLICGGEAALLAGRVDLELVIGWGVVAAIAGIGDAAMRMLSLSACICGMTVASVCKLRLARLN